MTQADKDVPPMSDQPKKQELPPLPKWDRVPEDLFDEAMSTFGDEDPVSEWLIFTRIPTSRRPI